MADKEYESRIKITGDTSGAEKIGKAYEETGKKADKATKSAIDGFNRAKNAVSRFNSAIRAITNISFIAGSVASVISLWDTLTERARKAKEEAAKLAVANAQAADAAKIDKLTEAYKKLGEEISNAAKERQRANELEDMQTSEADKLEDENAKLEKAQKLAALDPNDPAYEEKKRQIENAYEVAAAKRSVARTRRDAETKEKREYDEAEAKHGEATEKRFAAIGDREAADLYDKKAQEARMNSFRKNSLDTSPGSPGRFFMNLKRFITGDWSNMGSGRTAEGDEERARQREEAKRYEKLAEDRRKAAEEKEREANTAEAEASHASKKAGVYGMSAANTAVAQEAAAVTGAQSTAAADKAIADKERQLADAKAAVIALKEEQSRLKSQIAAEQANKDAANLAVYNAQGDMDTANRNGNRRGQAAESAALREAQMAAQNVNHEADKTINALTDALNSVNTRLKAAQSAIQNASKQQSYAWSESPSGQ